MRRRLLGSYLALTAVVQATLEIPLAVTYASREEASLEAELISIAGHYMRAEEIPSQLRGRSTQILLDAERLLIRSL